MRSLLLAALLLLPGCSLLHAVFGFDLTPGARYCGQVVGIDVWVDAHSTPEIPAMTCETAMATTLQARDWGAKKGFWPPTQVFNGYRLEYINEVPLKSIDSLGSGDAAGYTLTWSRRSAVTYGYAGYQIYNAEEPSSAAVILIHEMIHMYENGNASHCHWASKYSSAFASMKNSWSQSFLDRCENLQCVGSSCW